MNNTRIIFDDDFYRMGAVFLSKKFLKLKKKVKKRYIEINLPIPIYGFINEKEYKVWLNKAMKLQNKKDLPGTIIEDILRQFNLDPKKDNYRNMLSSRLFFNKQPWKKSLYSRDPISLISIMNGESKELWVKIEPWTKKSDYVKLWKSIKDIQKTIDGYRGKEKFKTTFKRDFAVYQLYLEAKRDKNDKRNLKYGSIIEIMSSYSGHASIAKLFKDNNFDDSIRSISSHFNKLLAGIDIL